MDSFEGMMVTKLYMIIDSNTRAFALSDYRRKLWIIIIVLEHFYLFFHLLYSTSFFPCFVNRQISSIVDVTHSRYLKLINKEKLFYLLSLKSFRYINNILTPYLSTHFPSPFSLEHSAREAHRRLVSKHTYTDCVCAHAYVDSRLFICSYLLFSLCLSLAIPICSFSTSTFTIASRYCLFSHMHKRASFLFDLSREYV